MMLLLFSCVSNEFFFQEYELSIQVSNPTSGASHQATLLYEWFGEGVLRYPMYPIDETTFDGDTVASWKVLVEKEQGEGLALYVWEDVDGDEALCSPENRSERAGLILVDGTELQQEISLELQQECLGAERLYGLLSD